MKKKTLLYIIGLLIIVILFICNNYNSAYNRSDEQKKTHITAISVPKDETPFSVFTITAKLLKNSHKKNKVLRSIAKLYTDENYYDRARDVILLSEYPDYELMKIAEKANRAGLHDTAIIILDKAFECLNSMPFDKGTPFSYKKIAKIYSLLGQKDKVILVAETLNRIFAGIASSKNSTSNTQNNYVRSVYLSACSIVLTDIGKYLAEEYEYSSAEKIAEIVNSRVIKIHILSEVARYMAKEEKKSESIRVFEKVFDNIDQLEDDAERSNTLAYVACRMALSGLIDKAVKTFDKAYDIAEGLKGDTDNVIEDSIMMISKDIPPKQKALHQLAFQYYWTIMQSDSISVIKGISKSKIANCRARWILNELVKKLISLEDYKEAERINNTISKESDRLENFYLIAEKYAQTDKKDQAVKFLNKLYNTIKEESKEAKYQWLLYKMAPIYAQSEDYDSALQIADFLKECSFGTLSYSQIANVYIANGIYDKALEIARIISPMSDAKNMNYSLIHITKDFLKEKRVKESVEVVKLIKDENYKTKAVGLIVEKLLKESNPDSALAIVDMIKDQVVIDKLQLNVVASYASLQKLKDASHIIDRIAEPAYKAKAISKLAVAFKDVDDTMAFTLMLQANQLVHTINNSYDKIDALIAVASNYHKIDAADSAEYLLDLAIKETRNITDNFIKLKVLAKIDITYLKIGLKNHNLIKTTSIEVSHYAAKIFNEINNCASKDPRACAFLIARSIHSGDNQANALVRVASLYAKDDKEKMIWVLERAVEAAKTRGYYYDEAKALANISAAYAKTGYNEKSMEILELTCKTAASSSHFDDTFKKANYRYLMADIALKFASEGLVKHTEVILGKIEGQDSKSIFEYKILLKIADAYILIGQEKNAKSVLSNLSKTLIDPESFFFDKGKVWAEIAIRYAAMGNINESLKLVEKTIYVSATVKALNGIVSKCIDRGETEIACNILERSFNTIINARQGIDKGEALNEVSIKYAKMNKCKKAEEILKNTEVDASKIHENLNQENPFLIIANEYIQDNQTEKVKSILLKFLKSLSKIKNNFKRSREQQKAATLYAQAGLFDESICLINTIENKEQKGRALAHIAEAYAERRQYLKAYDIVVTIDDNRHKINGLFEIAMQMAQNSSKLKDKNREILPLLIAEINKSSSY